MPKIENVQIFLATGHAWWNRKLGDKVMLLYVCCWSVQLNSECKQTKHSDVSGHRVGSARWAWPAWRVNRDPGVADPRVAWNRPPLDNLQWPVTA